MVHALKWRRPLSQPISSSDCPPRIWPPTGLCIWQRSTVSAKRFRPTEDAGRCPPQWRCVPSLAYPELAATKVDLAAHLLERLGAQGAAKIQRLMPPGDWAEAKIAVFHSAERTAHVAQYQHRSVGVPDQPQILILVMPRLFQHHRGAATDHHGNFGSMGMASMCL